jgi:general secretion pathway protein G
MEQKQKSRSQNERGFTLIEIMVVVVILGILAAVVVPRFLNRPDEARRTRAAVDIKAVESALGMFKLDNGFYPSTEQGLAALVQKPAIGRIPAKYAEDAYLKKVPVDPWGHVYAYLAPGAHGPYDLLSYGADGAPGGEGDDADIESWTID